MKRHKIKGCKAKALEILKAVKCCKKNNLKAPLPALSAEFIAAAGAWGGRTAYKKIGMAAGKFAEAQVNFWLK